MKAQRLSSQVSFAKQKCSHGRCPSAHCLPTNRCIPGGPSCHGHVREQHNGTERSNGSKPPTVKAQEIQEERDFFLSVLQASTTKREAKAYLTRFAPPAGKKAGQKGPKETAQDLTWDQSGKSHVPLHVALIKLRAPQLLDEEIAQGLVRTISQLRRLGLSCVIVLDPERDDLKGPQCAQSLRRTALEQSDRLVSELGKPSKVQAFRLDDALKAVTVSQEVKSTVPVRGAVEVNYRDLIARPLLRGIIPVVPPIAFTEESQRKINVESDDVVLALTREFAGLNRDFDSASRRDDGTQDHKSLKQTRSRTLILDRIILLDPLGGIPSFSRSEKPHVFVNLEQEYDTIREQMLAAVGEARCSTFGKEVESSHSQAPSKSPLGFSNPISTFLEAESGLISPAKSEYQVQIQAETALPYQRHLKNLKLLKHNLALLPPTSSALLTTPREAATLSDPDLEASAPGVGTRRPKNPLIFNLLTDKPLVSSSLPQARLRIHSDVGRAAAVRATAATFVKRGMPVTIIPNPHSNGWRSPRPGMKTMSLEDPGIDFPRLLNLIEDSFNRPLDVNHYLRRVRDKLAGVIIAGEYEGGAILTWESPPGVSPESEDSMSRMVPYLDKFAVLKRSQGAGGVADIVFSAMTRDCFPEGVCWRSRKSNPVNKWYFERSEGTFKIPNTDWAMFWTSKDLTQNMRSFLDYESVCRTVLPSWADNKHIVD